MGRSIKYVIAYENTDIVSNPIRIYAMIGFCEAIYSLRISRSSKKMPPMQQAEPILWSV
jgi:hypothetical protein